MREPEVPRWTLMTNSNGKTVTVRQQYEAAKRLRGWVLIARESDLWPFNPPKFITEPTR